MWSTIGLSNNEKTPTGQTPYSLAYRLEAVVPVEMTIPSVKIAKYNTSENEANQAIALNLIDEQCDKTELWNEAYKRNVAKYHNRQVHLKTFNIGSLVLHKVSI